MSFGGQFGGVPFTATAQSLNPSWLNTNTYATGTNLNAGIFQTSSIYNIQPINAGYPKSTPPQQAPKSTKSSSSNRKLLTIITVVGLVVVVVLAIVAVIVGVTAGGGTNDPADDEPQPPAPQPPQQTQAPVQPPTTRIDGDIFDTGTCGTRPTLNNRILGGTGANSGDWPWMGSLRDVANRHRCGAVLISDRWAVTAAHCVDEPDDPNDLIIVSVVFGDIDPSTESSFSQSSPFLSVVIHPQWNANDDASEYDIALIYLAVTIQINNYVRPSCLAELAPETSAYYGCYATGWGALSEPPLEPTPNFNDYPTTLQQIQLTLISTSECRRRVNGVINLDTENIICDGGVTNTGICSGDSGGPLVCRSNLDGYWHLVGIISSGVGCGVSYPAFYTRVTQFISWIESVV